MLQGQEFERLGSSQPIKVDVRVIAATNRPLEEMSDSGIINLNAENFTMYKSKIRQDLLKCFGHYAMKDLEIISTGKRPNTRYGIGIDRDKILVVF